MDYNYVESLAIAVKQGDENSKELIIKEFESYISSLSHNTFIYGYDVSDIKSECHKVLLTCLKSYNITTHRFVAYGINAIKQHLNYLIRNDNNRSKFEGKQVFSLLDDDEDSLICSQITAEENMCAQSYHNSLNEFVNRLSKEEKDLISFIFYKDNTVKDYAKIKNIPYTTAIYRRDNALKNLQSYLLKINI